jgi:hypothetical protein
MGMMNPSEMVSRLDLVVLELAAAGIVFRRLREGFRDFRVFIEQRGGGTGHRGGQHRSGRAWAPWCALVGVPHLGPPLWYFFGPSVVFWPRKNPQKVLLRLDSV